jgi:hypothetical protein
MIIDNLLKLPGKRGSTDGDHILDVPVDAIDVNEWTLVMITGVHVGGPMNNKILIGGVWKNPDYFQIVPETSVLERLLENIRARRQNPVA